MNSEKSNCAFFFNEKTCLNTTCIIAAAGQSSRMGQWKAMLPVNKSNGELVSLLENAVNTAVESCRKVIIVGGEQISLIREIIQETETLKIVENKDYRKGMLSSIQTAIPYVENDFFVLPMDMPLLKAVHMKRLFKEFRETGANRIVRPKFEGIPGHPVLFPSLWKDNIRLMTGRSLLKNLSSADQLIIEWEDDSVILDLDTPESYQRYLNDYSNVSD